MRALQRLLIAIVALVSLAAPALSEGLRGRVHVNDASTYKSTDDRTRTQLRSGNLKVWTGMALIVGGAFIVPVTAGTPGSSNPSDAAIIGGIGVAGAGTWLVWSGFQQRRKAVAPDTALGVALGPRTGVVIRRRW